MDGLGIFVGLMIAGIVIVTGWGVYDSMTAPTYDLDKRHWACTGEETYLLPVPHTVGKTTIVMQQPVVRCIRYERNK